MMNKTKSVRAMTECSIMIALSTVLSIIKLAELPYGGSITVASMLPIVIAVFRHGGKWGFGTALVYSVIEMLLGLKNFSYFTTPISFIALAVFDYVLAFSVFALAGIFKNRIKRQNLAALAGVLMCSLLRYGCHVISGATIWAGLSIPTEAALVYSLSYNATYMLPETIVLAVCALYVFSMIDFRRAAPVRISAARTDKVELFSYLGAGLALLSAIIAAVAIVFPALQDAESGEFMITNIKCVNVTALVIALSVGVGVAAILFAIGRVRASRK